MTIYYTPLMHSFGCICTRILIYLEQHKHTFQHNLKVKHQRKLKLTSCDDFSRSTNSTRSLTLYTRPDLGTHDRSPARSLNITLC